MNLAALSKEQKQKIMLVVVIGAAVIYGIYRFALVPVFNTMKESRDKLSELQDNLKKADQAIKSQAKVKQQLQESADGLFSIKERYLPSLGNPLTWATELIYDQGRELGIDIESVTPMGSGGIPWAKDSSVDRLFVPYVVRIATSCSYFDLVDLINSIVCDNPYASVKSIVINSMEEEESGGYNQQSITFQVEWPMWRDAEAVSLIHTPRKRNKAATPQG